MKKFLILLVAMIIVSCSNDDQITDPTIPPTTGGTKVKLPIDSKLKPAVKNTGNSSTTSRSNEVRKKLVKLVWLSNNKIINGAATNYTYNLNMTMEQYKALPTDNVYDVAEIPLNTNNVIFRNYLYSYNESSQLNKIQMQAVEEIGHTIPDEIFEYNLSGVAEKITKDQFFTYTYNEEDLIGTKLEKGELREKYTYDSQKRIIKCEFYMSSSTGSMLTARKDYTYIDSSHFNVYLYQIFPGSEEVVEISQYTIDINKPGIYNKEPFYQRDNSYVHTIECRVTDKNGVLRFTTHPKYFYDIDGYLMRIDLYGYNYPGDIRLFYYE